MGLFQLDLGRFSGASAAEIGPDSSDGEDFSKKCWQFRLRGPSISDRLVAPRTDRGEPPSERIPPADWLDGGDRGCRARPTPERAHGGGVTAYQPLKPDGPGRYPTRIAESHREIEGTSVKLEETTPRIANGGGLRSDRERRRARRRSRRARSGARAPAARVLLPGDRRHAHAAPRGGGRPRQGARGGDRGAARCALRDPVLRAARDRPLGRAARALAHGREALRVGRRRGDRRDRRARRARGQAPARAAAAAREGDGPASSSASTRRSSAS